MRKLLLIMAVALTMSCGSDTSNKGSNGGNGGGGGITEPSQLVPALWNELCDAVFTCPDANPELVLILGRYSSAAACKADVDNTLLQDLSFGQIELAIDEGRASLDSAQTSVCLADIRQSLCAGGGFENVPACEDVIVGQVPEGGNCADSEECSGGLDCNDFETSECYGTCVQSCGMTTCSESEFCNDGDVCTARLGAGQDCIFDDMCADGLVCNFSTNTCVAANAVSAGGACSRSVECASGLQCIDEVCGSFTLKAPGEACAIGDDVQEVCQPGSVCTDFEITATGATGTCGPPKALGGACRVFFECEAGLTCSTTNPLMEGECVALYANGQACQQQFDCQSGVCDEGVCAAAEPEMICAVP